MERLTKSKADFERIKYAYQLWKKSKFTQLEQCYKKPSEAKLSTYFNHQYFAKTVRHGRDFRIINASIQTYTFGYIYTTASSCDIFCYVLPTREIIEYIDILESTEE